LDGLKLPSNASKESSGTISELTKKKDKIQQKVKRLLKDQIEAVKDDNDDFRPPANREQQIDKLKKQADCIEKWLKENNAKISSNGTELKSNLTDNDSALMLSSGGTIWISPKKVDRVKRKVSASVFHIQLDKDNQVLSVFSADYRRPQYTQRWNARYPDDLHIVDDKPARFS
jgi:hypothetical protein